MKKVKLKILKDLITEGDIRRVCKDCLQIKGWFVFHLLQGLGCHPGLPDMVAIKCGRVLFLEIKKPGGKLSEHQQRFNESINRAGGEYYVVQSLEEIMKILEL